MRPDTIGSGRWPTPDAVYETGVLVLGAGLAGLSVAACLGDRCIVLEREPRPGGLVRTECVDGYWFDHVIHLLYFADESTQARVRALLADDLAPCPPVAWVETPHGAVRFPFQMHLGGLEPAAAARCVTDFARVSFGRQDPPPADFRQMLLQSFGEGMYEVFFGPYNRKMWKRPLESLAPSGFQWNIQRPCFEQVLRGYARTEEASRGYNADGWYPRPPAGAPVRGMEVLSRALATQARDLRLGCVVVSIDAEGRAVLARRGGRLEEYRFTDACVSSLPLPRTVAMCLQAPPALRTACGGLTRNRVLSAAFAVEGPRPRLGHWRYYTDESICFTRLVFLHEFDPDAAPPEGWPLLAELTERAEDPMRPAGETLAAVKRDLRRVGALPDGCRIRHESLMVVDPAYVVFTTENRSVVEAAREWLQRAGVVPLGRYGRWEYSSMAQVMRDGFECGPRLLNAIRAARAPDAHRGDTGRTGHAADWGGPVRHAGERVATRL